MASVVKLNSLAHFNHENMAFSANTTLRSEICQSLFQHSSIGLRGLAFLALCLDGDGQNGGEIDSRKNRPLSVRLVEVERETIFYPQHLFQVISAVELVKTSDASGTPNSSTHPTRVCSMKLRTLAKR